MFVLRLPISASRQGPLPRTAVLLSVCLTIACLFASLLPSAARAQDAQYWSEQFGTQANLLGGIVIGSVNDLSATYYNPGALGLLKETNFLLATKIFQYESLSMPRNLNDEIDLSSNRFGEAPDFLAGEIGFHWLYDDRLAYSILTRHRSDFEIKGRRVDQAPDGSGTTTPLQSGEISTRQSFSEYWAGITWAKALGQDVGIGVTVYGALRNQRTRRNFDFAASLPDGSVETVNGIEDLDYWNTRTLAKLGVGFSRPSYSLGMTLTTPSLDLFGDGSYFLQTSGSGNPLFPPPLNSPRMQSTYQPGLDGTYKNSWAVGLGGSYGFKMMTLHCSMEWFDRVDKYDVVHIDPYYPQTGGELQTSSKTVELNSVLNWGIGFEVPLDSKLYAQASFATDYSAAGQPDESSVTFSQWNIYQITGGMEFEFGANSVTLGLAYAFGGQDVKLSPVIPGEAEDADLPIDTIVRVDYRRLKLMLGLSLSF